MGKGYYNYQGSRKEKPAPELKKYLEQSHKLVGLSPIDNVSKFRFLYFKKIHRNNDLFFLFSNVIIFLI